jgi:phosphoribosyl-dephospho-CoA transferase
MAPSSSGQKQDTDVQDQVRGAMQQLGALKQQTETTLKSIATQFPGVSKDAGSLQSAFDQALSNLMRSLVKITQTPDPQGPQILR